MLDLNSIRNGERNHTNLLLTCCDKGDDTTPRATSRSGDDEADAAYSSNTFAGTQAASPCPDPHHPVHRHRMGTADWTACRLRERCGERRSAGCGESAVERRTKPDADIRGMNCRADAVHSLTILCLHGGSYRHAGNGVSCLTMPTLEPPTAHLRTGHAHEGRGRRLLSRFLPRRVAGCQARAGSPAPCAPPTERERQREGCTGPSPVAPRSAPRQPGTWNHRSGCATAVRCVHPPSACMRSHGVARRRSHRSSWSSAGFHKSRSSPA